MTAKRFKIGLDLITIEDTSKEYGALNQEEVVDELNRLNEENEELREQVKCLLEDLQSTNQINKEIVDDVREELLKENEQLKELNIPINEIKETVLDYKGRVVGVYYND